MKQVYWYTSRSYRSWTADIVEETDTYIRITFKRTQYQKDTANMKFGCWPDKVLYRRKDGFFQDDRKEKSSIFFSWQDYQNFRVKEIKEEIESAKDEIGRLKVELVVMGLETEEHRIEHYDREKYPEIVKAQEKYQPKIFGKNGSVTKMKKKFETIRD